jgi:Holliday junction resolvase
LRGAESERRVADLLRSRGFAVMRAPASGSRTKHPMPDLVAGCARLSKRWAIEVKTSRRKRLYVPHESIEQLQEFARVFGCEPYVAIKFKGSYTNWLFVSPDSLSVTPRGNRSISLKEALRNGSDLDMLLAGQIRL